MVIDRMSTKKIVSAKEKKKIGEMIRTFQDGGTGWGRDIILFGEWRKTEGGRLCVGSGSGEETDKRVGLFGRSAVGKCAERTCLPG
jgi:hypothetical protein